MRKNAKICAINFRKNWEKIVEWFVEKNLEELWKKIAGKIVKIIEEKKLKNCEKNFEKSADIFVEIA